jgi:deoxyribodipyrimidine photo-lyase
LAWREFCADVLWHQPRAVWASLDARFDTDMEYDHDERAFEEWTQGRTGYPFVDAGMRQLLAEGWMHNRLRMVTASFLVKDLHQPWQRGAAWFMQHLVDADVANNQLGWQWVAGCGTDAAPYFRIFNPVTQGRRFDPDGDYIRRHLPELAETPDPHEPGVLAADYPAPLVDHAHERDAALARFQALPPRG